MNILFIIKVKVLMFIKWSYRFPPQKKELKNQNKIKIVLSIEPKMVSMFELVVQSPLKKCLLDASS